MERFLAFVTIDKWTMIFTWGNLIVLYLLMKKFLFKPVKGIIDAREKEVGDMLADAETSRKEAQAIKEEYSQKLADAKSDAEQILNEAVRKAHIKEKEITDDAQNHAKLYMERAKKDIELEKKKAADEIRGYASDMAVEIASKIIRRDVSADEHEEMIKNFIDGMGDIK